MVKMKHCCKNVVILMPEPVAEPALNGLRLNLRIVSIVMFNFASYLTIGLPLAVLPGYVHDVMGFSAFWAGLQQIKSPVITTSMNSGWIKPIPPLMLVA